MYSSKTKVIGLCGNLYDDQGSYDNKRVGKDVFAEVAKEVCGEENVKILSFASGIKETLCKIFGTRLFGAENDHLDRDKEVTLFLEKDFLVDAERILFEEFGKFIGEDRCAGDLTDLFMEVFDIYDHTLIHRTTVRKAQQLFGTEFGRKVNTQLWIDFAKESIQEDKINIFTDMRFLNEKWFIEDLDCSSSTIQIARFMERPEDLPEHHPSMDVFQLLSLDHVLPNIFTLEIFEEVVEEHLTFYGLSEENR